MIRLPPNAVMAKGLELNTPPMPSIIALTFCSARTRSGASL
jgi:hypothetical protein